MADNPMISAKGDRLPWPQTDEIGDGSDRPAVDALGEVAGRKARRFRRAAGDDAADARRHDRLADEIRRL